MDLPAGRWHVMIAGIGESGSSPSEDTNFTSTS